MFPLFLFPSSFLNPLTHKSPIYFMDLSTYLHFYIHALKSCWTTTAYCKFGFCSFSLQAIFRIGKWPLEMQVISLDSSPSYGHAQWFPTVYGLRLLLTTWRPARTLHIPALYPLTSMPHQQLILLLSHLVTRLFSSFDFRIWKPSSNL